MLSFPRRTFLAVVAFGALPLPAWAKKPETEFLDRQLVVNHSTYRYQVFVPANWSSKQKWPIILFLHGAGERGDDGLVQTEVGIGTAIRRGRERFPAIIVMPQRRRSVWWTEETMTEAAMAMLNAPSKEFHGDANRTYLTGLSMGGYGTWAIAEKYPRRFAAIVPICGGVLMPDISRSAAGNDTTPYAEAAKKIGNKVPVWIFHGAADPIVPVEESRRMNEAVKALGGEVKYAEYPGIGHDSWVKAYAEPELITWMLSKSLSRE